MFEKLLNKHIKSKYTLMNCIYSNSNDHQLTQFFRVNCGLRTSIGKRIALFVNAF
jgi:hypothetical protein